MHISNMLWSQKSGNCSGGCLSETARLTVWTIWRSCRLRAHQTVCRARGCVWCKLRCWQAELPHHLVPMCSFCSPWERALPSLHLQRPRSRSLRMREDAVQGVCADYRNVVRQPSKRRGKPRNTDGMKCRAAEKGAVQKCPSLLWSISYTNV